MKIKLRKASIFAKIVIVALLLYAGVSLVQLNSASARPRRNRRPSRKRWMPMSGRTPSSAIRSSTARTRTLLRTSPGMNWVWWSREKKYLLT